MAISFFKQHMSYIIGIIAGSILGYAYYHFVGCNGQCMIASNPLISTGYGALMGFLSVNAFGRKPMKKEQV
jgi:hypothetical protein